MMSGPRPLRLVLLTLLVESGIGGAAGVVAGGAAVELLDGPDVWSSGFPSGSSISTSGISFADALPDASLPIGIRASRGCLSVSLGTVAGIRQVSSYLCKACPLGFGYICPFFPFQVHPGQVHSGSSFASGTSWCLHSPAMRLCVRMNLPWQHWHPWQTKTCLLNISDIALPGFAEKLL